MGAPLGNQNARKRHWTEAITAAVQKEVDPATGRRKIHAIADKLIEIAEAGDIQAMKEIGDRLDGKAVQSLEHSGPGGEPLPALVQITGVETIPQKDT